MVRAARAVVGVVMVTGLLTAAPSASAARIVVEHTADSATPGSGSLRAAVSLANTSPGNDVIVLRGGETYALTRCGTGSDAGDLDVNATDDASLTIRAVGGGLATIVQTCSDERVLQSHDPGRLLLDHVRLSGGDPAGSSVSDRQGGGIRSQGSLVLERSAIIGNTTCCSGSGGAGGGIYAVGDVVLRRSRVARNSTGLNGSGGGVFGQQDLVAVRSVISGNRAGSGVPVGGHGGGAFVMQTARIVRSTIAGNRAGPGAFDAQTPGSGGSGGGLAASNAVVRFSTFTGNHTGFGGSATSVPGSPGGSGGGIASGRVSIVRSTIARNVANGGGTGSGGDAADGGGAGVSATEGNILTSTISRNQAAGSGGAIRKTDATTLSVIDTTMVRNRADTDADGDGIGGGVSQLAGQLRVRNTIMALNLDPSNPGSRDCSGEIVSRGFNIIGVRGGCAFAVRGTDSTGSAGNPLNPRVGRLSDNGGPTMTNRLVPMSPAVDHGPGAGSRCQGRDQRGVRRPVGPRCDTGSFELRL